MIHHLKVFNEFTHSDIGKIDGNIVTPRMALDYANIPINSIMSLNGIPVTTSLLDTPISQLICDGYALLLSAKRGS